VQPASFVGANLVFLIDVSGSMAPPNRLPLLKSALSMLVQQLDHRTKVSIVVYAGASGLVLPPTPGDDKRTILRALDRLGAGGSTNGGEGIRLAYAIAKDNFVRGGVNRVILATDGDFNVGVTNQSDLVDLVRE
jgi:Ca-activated chloride channel family protein